MLATQLGLTNKVVSERHYYASQEKMTAGEAAKVISKHTGKKVLAKDVKELYQVHYGYEAEWHHSGFYRSNKGKTMGRTFFLTDEEVDELKNNYDEICAKRNEQIRKDAEELKRRKAKIVHGFYWTWSHDYGGNYGKKRTFKVLQVYEGSDADKPSRNFTLCSPKIMDKVKAAAGRKYFGWDEPSISDFKQ
jgi:hypothetical protein